MRSIGMARATGLFAAVAALAVVATEPAAAFTVLRQTGTVGEYQVTDANADPGGRCGYGDPNANGVARFIWLRIPPPSAFARDITTGRDRQPVEWRARLQIGRSETGPWRTVDATPWERARAFDDAPAELHRRKLVHSSRGTAWYRGLIAIRWLRAGAVEGSVTLAIDHYSVRWEVGDPSFVFDGPCWNKAD